MDKKVYALLAQWYQELESPTTVLGVYSTREKAEQAGEKWYKSPKFFGYCWIVKEVDYVND